MHEPVFNVNTSPTSEGLTVWPCEARRRHHTTVSLHRDWRPSRCLIGLDAGIAVCKCDLASPNVDVGVDASMVTARRVCGENKREGREHQTFRSDPG
jgi:hypothetical protein